MNIKTIRMKTIAMTCAMAVGSGISMVAMAADATFSTDGGDLASAADWGGSKPANTSRVRFAADSALTATASSDITFAGLYLNKKSQNVTLDMRGRKVTLTDHIYIGDQSDQTLNIKGGYWDLVGKLNLYWRGATSATTWVESNQRQHVNISDGAVVNVFRITTGYGPNSACTVNVAGEGTVVTSAVLRIGAMNACYDHVDITEGAKVVVTNNGTADLVIGYSGNANNYECGVVVSGSGSQLIKKNPGKSFVSHEWARNCYLHVLDGAAAEFDGELLFAASSATAASSANNNTILVSGSGSTLAMKTGYMGYSSGSTHNRGNIMQVRDGARVTGDLLYVGGNGNGIVVSNATVSLTGGGIKDFTQNAQLGTNIFVRLQGSSPRFTTDRTGSTGGRNILHRSFRFVYDLPAEGYAQTPVKFLSESATDRSLEIEVNGIDEVVESMKRRNVFRQEISLLSASGGWSVNEGVTSDMVTRWNSKLPEGASLSYANDELTLTIKRKGGLLVVFR